MNYKEVTLRNEKFINSDKVKHMSHDMSVKVNPTHWLKNKNPNSSCK